MGLKMKVKAVMVVQVMAMAFLLFPAISCALEIQQMALRGLKGVSVLVEHIKPEAERLGITQDQIKTDVELRLRKAGIRVLAQTEKDKTPGMPYLYVNVTALISSEAGLCVYGIEVHLKEIVTLARGLKASGSVWDTGKIGSVGTQNIRKIRDGVGDLVDKFINDYLAANPK